MINSITDWRNWIRGLVGAVIGGGANAVLVCLVEPASFNFGEGLKKLATFTFASAIIAAALYLKQKPLPDEKTVTDPSNSVDF